MQIPVYAPDVKLPVKKKITFAAEDSPVWSPQFTINTSEDDTTP